MGAEYAELRKHVISWYRGHVLNETITDDTITLATPLPSSVYTEAEGTNLLANIAGSPYHDGPYLSTSYPPSLLDLSSTD